MATTPSTMTELGRNAPQFALPNVLTGKTMTLGDFEGRTALLVMLICKHCPYVLHVKPALIQLARITVINRWASFPYVQTTQNVTRTMRRSDLPRWLENFLSRSYDETQEVAKAYRAACTPDFFLFDSQHRLVYRGQLDDSRPGNNRPLTGRDLRAAIDAVLAGKPVKPDQRASIGCNIKWKPGNEPNHY